MKPSKNLTFTFFVASLAFGSALADPAVSSNDLSFQTSTSDTQRGGGFGTNAKVALLRVGTFTIRSLNVAQVTNPSTGIYCITPSVKLNFQKIYPQVTIERSYSVGFAFWAYWLDTTNNAFTCASNQLEVLTYTLNGTAVQLDNQVAFTLIVE